MVLPLKLVVVTLPVPAVTIALPAVTALSKFRRRLKFPEPSRGSMPTGPLNGTGRSNGPMPV